MSEEKEKLDSVLRVLTSEDTKNWREVLKLGSKLEVQYRRSYSWVWPTLKNLQQFKSAMDDLKIETILSVGCGSGLLEWIIRECIGVAMFGLEVDRAWWQSKYSMKSFIEVRYFDVECLLYVAENAEPDDGSKILQNCCQTDNWNFALVFCYFNNREAFLNYLQWYKGNCLILIGPHQNTGVHTDPVPMEPHFPIEPLPHWRLHCALDFGTEAMDVVAIYTKAIN